MGRALRLLVLVHTLAMSCCAARAAAQDTEPTAALPSLDLVLSHFTEPVEDVVAFVARAAASLPHARMARVFLYTHAPPGSLPNNTVPANWSVFHSANAGRESHNYLNFLTHHASRNLSDLIWFSQARPDLYMQNKLWPRLPLITRRTGMLGLSIMETCDCEGHGIPRLATLLHEIHAMALLEFCGSGGIPSAPHVSRGAPPTWVCFFNGEFVVSRRRIKAQPHRLYTYLRDALAAPPTSWLHMEYLEGRESTVVDPTLGYVMERSWNLLFKCLHLERPICCEGDVPCEVDMCQCLDREGEDGDVNGNNTGGGVAVLEHIR